MAAAVTIPPMDGALKPNTALDERRLPSKSMRRTISAATGKDSSSPRAIRFTRCNPGKVEEVQSFDAPVTALAVSATGDLAIGLDNGELGLMPR